MYYRYILKALQGACMFASIEVMNYLSGPSFHKNQQHFTLSSAPADMSSTGRKITLCSSSSLLQICLHSGGSRNAETGVKPLVHEAHVKIFGLPHPLRITLMHSGHT